MGRQMTEEVCSNYIERDIYSKMCSAFKVCMHSQIQW